MELADILSGLPTGERLPPLRRRTSGIPHAPKRNLPLSLDERKQAVKNALRYVPSEHHDLLSKEFAQELEDYGHIYMYRFMPTLPLRAYPISSIKARTPQCAAIIHMILNNLDPAVAQFPEELVTYGGNGQVFSNWAQFRIALHYLSTMTDEQTLTLTSGHPQGLFPSGSWAPRVVITNGMVIPNYSSKVDYDRYFGLGVSMYGQMTAGSYCYIGPQGIVHGTTITILNAGRKYLNTKDLSGKVFLTSGLGGMSGAQPKAGVISGCVCVVAEVNKAALEKRLAQGWVMEATDNLDDLIQAIRTAREKRVPKSIAYHGNVVDVWEKLADMYEKTGEQLIELGSDQTSCHNVYGGGYFPVGLEFDEAKRLLETDAERFCGLVKESLLRQLKAIDVLARGGLRFWDYGNAFLLECYKAGADIQLQGGPSGKFRYPSYVEDIMGDIFSMGFGPFRWVCTSGKDEDLAKTDEIALRIMTELKESHDNESVKQQYSDNIRWIKEAAGHNLVVGSKARILYSDMDGRVALGQAFNAAIAAGQISAPVVLSRDHHDVSGTDSPFRETSNITDGSKFTADMAIQNVIGDAFRGATWVAIHNGGGVGWGEVINGGFGLVLDGSEEASQRVVSMLTWDVLNGVSRRGWSGNAHAQRAVQRAMSENGKFQITTPHPVDDSIDEMIGNILK